VLKFKIFTLILSVCFLSGCDSEVDKCAKAFMKDGVEKESRARAMCLQLANPVGR